MRSAYRLIEQFRIVEVFDTDVPLRIRDAQLPTVDTALTRLCLHRLAVKLEPSPHMAHYMRARAAPTHVGRATLLFRSMSSPARFLLGTIIVGILVLFLCGLALRRPPVTDPFDKPAPAADVR